MADKNNKDTATMMMNVRASSISPTSTTTTMTTTNDCSSSSSNRNVRPPPPVRPKPKRAITAPILPLTMKTCPEIHIIDDADLSSTSSLQEKIRSSTTLTSSSSSTAATPTAPGKISVKALAERFNKTPPAAESIVKSTTTEISEVVDGGAKRQRNSTILTSGGSSSALLRFAKPQPPQKNYGSRTTSSLTDALGNTNVSSNGKRLVGSLERRHKQKKNLEIEETFKKNAKKLKRSQSYDYSDSARNLKSTKKSIRRRNSIDCSNIPIVSISNNFEMKKLRLKFGKKTPPPAVPPKPAKKLSISPANHTSPNHEYVTYDILPSTTPASVFEKLSPTIKKENTYEESTKRMSLPAEKLVRQLPETPTSSILPTSMYDSPGRFSLGTPSSINQPNLATMELLNDSQLNISGHIYCAVRHGEVIEDEDEIRDSSILKNGFNNEIDAGDDELSFSSAVFDAIEMATGRRIKTDEYGNRFMDEDAMTNYEEIMEDLPISTTKDDNPIETKDKKSSSPLMDEQGGGNANDQCNKWETCSSLTSTSADSGSSSNNAHAPMLIGFRRRSSNERLNEKDDTDLSKRTTQCTLTEDDLAIDDPTPTEASTKSYSPVHQQKLEKRDRVGITRPSRQSRPKSQLDMAANSLWRIKSDIQLNLSQAMGKIRLKVSSTGSTAATPTTTNAGGGQSPNKNNEPIYGTSTDAGKKNDQKARSTFYLPTANSNENASTKNNLSKHPTSISITLEAGLGDEMASSTAASSDEDEEDEEEIWDDTLQHEPGQDSTIRSGDSEETTPTAGGGTNLPDLVPQGRKQTEPLSKTRPLEVFRDDDMATTTDSSSPSATTDGESTILPLQAPPTTTASTSRPQFLSESSCTSTVASAIGELERFELVYNSRFAFSEPLYQHYRSQTAMVQRNQTFSEGDGKGTISRRDKLLNTSQLGSQRTLWCELPEVQGAGLLQRMTDEERKLQEAMFEVITSEASYLRSLNILITQFMASPHLSGNTALGSCITKQERKQLFSNILSVRDCSERLLCALECRLEENVLLVDVCDLIYEHLRRDCEIYVKYCANQIYQERTLNDLRRTNAEFRQVVSQLETSPVCECLNLRSFLMLPMQRVTRYPLLAAAILQRTEENSQLQATAQRAYGIAGRVVRQCNEGAKRLERIEQLVELDQTLIYREGGPKRVAFVSGSRWLIKKGALIHLLPRRHTLGVRGGLRHRRLHLFLFTDLLLIAKPVDGERRFVVKDYCPRQFVELTPLEPSCPQVPEGSNLPSNSRLVLITLMKNHRGRQVQLMMNCETETDKTRWLEAVRPTSAQEEGAERIYEPWDCPQVRVMTEYKAVQEDELELEVGEIINVLRKMPDGWYEGERLSNGEKGWFPGYLTEEILSDHIRAKNYRDRLRFINEAELIQRSILMGDNTAQATAVALASVPSSSTGTNSRRSSIIPTAAKALFRF